MMKKVICMLTVLALMLAMFAGCGSQPAASSTAAEPSAAEASAVSNVAEIPAEEPEAPMEDPSEAVEVASVQEEPVEEVEAAPELVLPLCDETTTLTYWLNWTPGGLMTGYLDTLADHVAILAAEEMTNVHIEFTEVDNMTATEKFQLMVAGGDYPDMVRGLTGYYNGGGTKAVEDDVIIPLNDMLEELAPHYWNLLCQYDLLKDTATDDGDFLAIYNIDDEVLPNSVAAIRQDWLDELDLEAPKTYDEYHEVLTAFKNAFDLDEPLSIPAGGQENSYLVGGYGVSGNTGTSGLFQVDGTVYCSFIEDGYRDYLTMLNQWYAEGLINKDFFSAETGLGATDIIAANVMDDKIGIFYTNYSRIRTLVSSTGDENFRVVGITDAVKEEGDINHFGVSGSLTSGITVSITTACQTPEIAVQWLNFWFSEEGQLMANWGIENESYVFDAESNPAYTEMVSNNPDGMVMMAARTFYTMNQVPTLLVARRTFGVLTEDEANAAAIFATSIDGKNMMPSNITVAAEEAEEAASLISDIATYADPEIIRFITGEKPLDEWEDYVATIESMNISRVIEIYQDALDAYNAR